MKQSNGFNAFFQQKLNSAEHMLLPLEKHFEMSKKVEQKYPRLCIDILRAYIKFFKKSTFFVTCVKNTKKRQVHNFFYTKICLFYTRQ
jgi:hypothetical protein